MARELLSAGGMTPVESPTRASSLLDRVLPSPRLHEQQFADLAASPARVWQVLRHGNLARTRLVRALFALRTLPSRVAGQHEQVAFRLDDLRSSEERPGFQVLEEAEREVVVGAIGKVWQLDIPFVHVADAAAFNAFATAGFVKVAWSLRVVPRGDADCRVEFELSVDATDEESWRKFRRYFRVIGPGSHFIRRALLSSLLDQFGEPRSVENARTLPGDELLDDPAAQVTDSVTIHASAAAIWPWLVQLGCRRAGFYSFDWLDNARAPSARELHPDLQKLALGQVIPATPEGDDGFEVLELQAPQVLVLGGLYDVAAHRQLPFRSNPPEQYWQVTWAFVLEELDARTTRLHVRARANFSPDQGLHAAWIRPVHHFMEATQLRHLAARVEGRLPRDSWADVAEGVGGAALIQLALLTPFLRPARSHWGLDAGLAQRAYPGDELVPAPSWSFTHGVEIDASAASVWRWAAQIGEGRAGFYSYQWLENLAGCDIQNAESIHPEWEHRAGDELRLHPKVPPLRVVRVEPEHYLLAHAGAEPSARAEGKPWAETSWLIQVESLSAHRCRLISRYRAASSEDLTSRLSYGPALLEPISFAMDRRMLLGIKQRAERALRRAAR